MFPLLYYFLPPDPKIVFQDFPSRFPEVAPAAPALDSGDKELANFESRWTRFHLLGKSDQFDTLSSWFTCFMCPFVAKSAGSVLEGKSHQCAHQEHFFPLSLNTSFMGQANLVGYPFIDERYCWTVP